MILVTVLGGKITVYTCVHNYKCDSCYCYGQLTACTSILSKIAPVIASVIVFKHINKIMQLFMDHSALAHTCNEIVTHL